MAWRALRWRNSHACAMTPFATVPRVRARANFTDDRVTRSMQGTGCNPERMHACLPYYIRLKIFLVMRCDGVIGRDGAGHRLRTLSRAA